MEIVAPSRISRSTTQVLVAPLQEVFPLLCPVREVEWVEGTEPELALPTSGGAELNDFLESSHKLGEEGS